MPAWVTILIQILPDILSFLANLIKQKPAQQLSDAELIQIAKLEKAAAALRG